MGVHRLTDLHCGQGLVKFTIHLAFAAASRPSLAMAPSTGGGWRRRRRGRGGRERGREGGGKEKGEEEEIWKEGGWGSSLVSRPRPQKRKRIKRLLSNF